MRESHGMCRSPEYRNWTAMKTRCHNPNSPAFDRYGARGVTVCDRWRMSFTAFYADMGPRPTRSHTIDRIDNSKGYEPGNCRWATAEIQSRNRARCHLTWKGQTRTIREWAAICGVTVKTIRKRRNAGLPLDQVLTPATPRGQRWNGSAFWKLSPNHRQRQTAAA